MKTKRIFAIILLVAVFVTALAGCNRQSAKVSYNISKEADLFNVVRRITVINCRTDTVLFQMTGTFSLSNSSYKELEVICELPDGTYSKHYIYLNEWTSYVVEDLSGTSVSKYSYELNFLPQNIPGVTITTND